MSEENSAIGDNCSGNTATVDPEPKAKGKLHRLIDVSKRPTLEQADAITADSDSLGGHLKLADVILLLRLVASGATNEEIAKETHCSERTVKRRIKQISTILGARNRAQTVAIALNNGLISFREG